MGLIAREIEARGIPTLSMSSAYSITAAVNPPRAVYLDYPLGRTAGKPNDLHNQMEIMASTLNAFQTIKQPGSIVELPFAWATDDSWKDRVMRPQKSSSKSAHAEKVQHDDDRVARFDTPQYQTQEDEQLAAADCPSCVFLTDT